MIHSIIKPENRLEENIISDPAFIAGANFGEPRPGHPEGKVIFHIGEVLDNVNKYSPAETREKLRLIALLHDTFKLKVDHSQPKTGENHHAMIARRFAEKYISDTVVLDIIELHDEAYNAWQMSQRGDSDKAEQRAKRLIERLAQNTDLFFLFYRCDNETGNKVQDNLFWFEEF